MSAQGRTLILSDGGLTSLLAAAIVSERDSGARDLSVDARSLVWACATAGDLDAACVRAASNHAEIFSLEFLPPIAGEGTDIPALLGLRGEVETLTLLRACYLAAARGRQRVLWPVQLGAGVRGEAPDLDAIARAIDRATLVTRLVNLDESEVGGIEITIETPFVDLDDAQVADLALDMELATDACWWSGAYGQAPGSRVERERWLPLLGDIPVDEPATA